MNTKVKAALILNLEKSSCSICRIVNLIELTIIESIKTIYKSIICSNGIALMVEPEHTSDPIPQIQRETGVLH